MPVLIFDFDSTLVRDEGLDELFRHSLEGVPDGEARMEEFRAITDQGMEGGLGYGESLRRRMGLLRAHRSQVEATAGALAERLSPSVLRNVDFFREGAGGIHVVSGGFSELIFPAAERLGISPMQVHAQHFRFNPEGWVVGIDPTTPLARGGKAAAVAALELDPLDTWIVGDGATDLEIRELGLAGTFVVYTENRTRKVVVEAADHVASSMEELLVLLSGA